MAWAFLLGRLIFGLFFIVGGVHHFLNPRLLGAYASAKHVPVPRVTVPLTGIQLILGGASVATGYEPVVGGLLLVLLLVPAAFWMHNFWAERDPMLRAIQLGHFAKNLALGGAALALMGVPTPWPLSVGG